ncbi:MAG: hypothetical protein HXY20_14205 [Acidobacteria bacterium]|nr:hypothetical protein [Acidobacteriota bacterium]
MLIIGRCLFSDPELGVDAILHDQGQSPMSLSSLMVDGDVHQMIDKLIRSEGGGRFLDSPALFEIKYFQAETGNPPEPTAVALVFDRKSQPAALAQSLSEKLGRAREWERLGRVGDAMLSYRVALDAHPDNPELLYGLALLQKRFWRLLPRAVTALKKCREARPECAEYALALAECYQGVLDHDIQIVGASAEDIREKIVDLLAAAARLKPDEPSISERLRKARAAAGSHGEEGFFG